MLTVTFSKEIVQVGGDFGEGLVRLECFEDEEREKGESLDMDDEADNSDKDEPREWERSIRFNFVGEDIKDDDFLLFPLEQVGSSSSWLSLAEELRMFESMNVMESS